MKIAIIGAGAMGSLFGGLLKKTGNDVVLIDVWKEHIDAVNENGLIIEKDDLKMTVSIPAVLPEDMEGAAELLIVFTKSFSTEEAFSAVKGIITKESLVLTLQNGIGHVDVIRKFVPQNHIVHGITTYPCDLVGPGHIRSKGEGFIKMMSVDGKRGPMLESMEKMLNKAGLCCEITPNVVVAIWEKLAFNAVMNALTAVMNLTVGQVGDAAEGRELAEQIVDEIISVAHRKKIAINKDRIMSMVSMAFKRHRDHRPSMLQDILAKRKTEIDFINGAVIRKAAEFDMHLHVNETLYRMVRTIEKTNGLK